MKAIKLVLLTFSLNLIFFNAHTQPTFTSNYPDTLIKKRLRNVILTESTLFASSLSFFSFYLN